MTEQTAAEKEHIRHCKFYCYKERICTLESAIVSLHFSQLSTVLLCAKEPKRQKYIICSLALLPYICTRYLSSADISKVTEKSLEKTKSIAHHKSNLHKMLRV